MPDDTVRDKKKKFPRDPAKGEEPSESEKGVHPPRDVREAPVPNPEGKELKDQ